MLDVGNLWSVAVNRARTPLLIAICITFAFLYCYGSIVRIHRVNLNFDSYDQSAIMWYAKMMHDTRFGYPGDANRMPLYPIILSFFYRPDMPLEHFFVLGKYMNFVLSLVLLIGIFLIIGYFLPSVQALALVGITAFTVYLFRASYLHPDQLYYFLNFVAFILMAKMLLQPTIVLAGACGFVAALAHLTKASMLFGFAVFAFFFCVRMVSHLFLQRNTGEQISESSIRFSYNLACLGAVLLVFFAVLYPHISSNKKVFGRYFYNVNTTFYVWYDSWEEAKQGTRAHGDRVGWPTMPPQELPGPLKYWREHTLGQMAYRLVFGSAFVLFNAITSFGWFKYFLLLPAIAIVGLIANQQETPRQWKRNRLLVMFVVSYFALYFGGYCWNGVIGAHSRYTLSMFLPVVFSSVLVINTMFDESNAIILRGKRLIVSRVWAPIFLVAICLELLTTISGRIMEWP